MSEKTIEKSFLYFVLLSIVFHVVLYGLASLVPPEPVPIQKQATMVELKDLPEPPPPQKPKPVPKPKPEPKPKPQPKPKPKPEPPKPEPPKPEPPKPQPPKPEPVTVAKQVPLPVPVPRPLPAPAPAPRPLPSDVTVPKQLKGGTPKAGNTSDRSAPARTPGKDQRTQSAGTPGKSDSVFRTPEKGGKEIRRGEGLFKAKQGDRNELAKLFPSSKSLGSLEETYREKYRDAEQGDTRMIDTGDPLIAVFSHRLLHAANESLSLEGRKRMVMDRGVGVVKVTINRDGSIDHIEIMETSKSASLDDLVIASIKKAGYVGPLPKKWPHEQLKLLWIFYSRGAEPG